MAAIQPGSEGTDSTPKGKKIVKKGWAHQLFREEAFLYYNDDIPKIRHNIGHFLHKPAVEYLMLSLLIIDVLCVAVEIYIELHILEEEVEHYEHLCHDSSYSSYSSYSHRQLSGEGSGIKGLEPWEEAEHIIHSVSVIILFCFLTEALLLMIAKGLEYFTFFYTLDLFVICTSIAFDLSKHETAVVQLLIIMRIWRFARIVHGVYMATHIHTDIEEHGPDKHDSMSVCDALQDLRTLLPDYDHQQVKSGIQRVTGLFGTKGHVITFAEATQLSKVIDRTINELLDNQSKAKAETPSS